MTYVCSECRAVLDRPDPDPGDHTTSHGLCDVCASLWELALDIEQGASQGALLERVEAVRDAYRAQTRRLLRGVAALRGLLEAEEATPSSGGGDSTT